MEGINENSIDHSVLTVTVDPNPARESANLMINIPESGLVRIDIYSLLGQHMLQKEFDFTEPGQHTVKLDVSHFIPGIYFYTVSLKAQRINGKLIIE